MTLIPSTPSVTTPQIHGLNRRSRSLLRHRLVALAMLIAGMALPLASHADDPQPSYVAGEVIVRFLPDVPSERIAQIEHVQGLELIGEIPHLRVRHYAVPEGTDVEDAIAKLARLSEVEYAEPNYIHRTLAIPNDPRFGLQWALHNTGQEVNGREGPPDVDIDWPEAIDIFTGTEQVVVAVIDSGVALPHPDIEPRIWLNLGEESVPNDIDDDNNGYVDDILGWNFIDGNPAPLDDIGHGTLVASVIAAQSNDEIGNAGVAPTAQVMSLRVADELRGFGGPVVTLMNFLYATTYAAQNGARIINYSAGTTRYTNTERSQVEWLDDQGVLLVAAAGNGNFDSDPEGDDNDFDPIYPASYPTENVISVAASNRLDELTSCSNFGAVSVDLAAPGEDIDGADVNRRLVLFEDFESGAPGWTVDNNCPSTCFDWVTQLILGDRWLTDSGLFVDYSPLTDTWTESPFFTVGFGPRVIFQSWYELSLLDFFLVEASTDGVTWTTLRTFFGTSTATPLIGAFEAVDLTGFEGQTLKLRFRLLALGLFGVGDGVFVDDVFVLDVDDFAFDGTQFETKSGTSFSAPLVAGVAALLMSQRPDLTHREVRELILENVDPLPSLSGLVASGGGLNAYKALQAAIDFAVCGNGVLESGEICDDGNLINGDGCSDVCLEETGYTCTGNLSECTLDLTVVSVQGPAAAQLGNSISVQGDAAQTGSDSTGTVVFTFFFSEDQTIDPAADRQIGSCDASAVPAGEEASCSDLAQVPLDLIALAPGEEATFYFGGCVEDTGLTGGPETCEAGNAIVVVPEPSVWLIQLAAFVVLGLLHRGSGWPLLAGRVRANAWSRSLATR